MRRFVLIVLGGLLLTSPAFGGVAMMMNGCPGNPGALTSATLDCAGGGSVTLDAVYQPDQVIPDLVEFGFTLQITTLNANLADAPFWDMVDGSPCFGLGTNPKPPASGCSGWPNLWSDQAGTAVAGMLLTPNSLRVAATVFQQSPIPVAPGQSWFLMQLTIDLSHATEAGGTCAGCATPVRIDWTLGRPVSNGDVVPTPYPGCADLPPTFCNDPPLATLTLNDQAVPVKRQTWGALKALYR